jgi:hypothetical protein
MTEKFLLGAYWKSHRLTMREYIESSRRFLTELQRLHPIFKELLCQGETEDSTIRLQADLGNLEQVILRHGYDKKLTYTDARPDGGPSLESDCQNGFITHYVSDKPVSKGGVDVMITAGAYSPWLNNSMVISFPMAHHPEFFEYGFVKRLLVTTVECWQPEWAVVTSHAFRKRVMGRGARAHIGWLTYFARPEVKSVLPSGLECELLGQGALITTARQTLSPEVEAHVQTALQIRDALQGQGLPV